MNKLSAKISKRNEITILNVLYCLIVIFIHVSSNPVTEVLENSLFYYVVGIPWRLSAFVVQGFIFLSSVKIFLKKDEKTDYKKYYISRFKLIFLPYLLCALVYYAYLWYERFFDFSISHFIFNILTGDISGHFYFVIVIMQFYLLVPVFKWIVNKYNPKVILIISLIITVFSAQILPQLVFRLTGVEFKYAHILFTSYLIYWIGGCYVGAYYEKFKEFLFKRNLWIVSGFALIAIAEVVIYFFIKRNFFLIETFHILYCIVAIMFTYLLSSRIVNKYDITNNFIIKQLDAVSYNVYLIHSLFVFVINDLLAKFHIYKIDQSYIIRIVFVYTVSIVGCILYKKYKDLCMKRLKVSEEEEKGTDKLDSKTTFVPVMLFSLTILISSLCFIFKIPLSRWSVFFAFILLTAFSAFTSKKMFVSCCFVFASVVLSLIVSGQIYDTSYDGMYYHKEAIEVLANEWNPLFEPYRRVGDFVKLQNLGLILDNYPKGVWSFYAGVYNFLGKIECAKGLNIIFIFMLFSCAYDTIKTVFGKRGILGILLSLVFVLNPVICSQYFTYMNDLPVAVVVMMCAFLGMKIYADKADKWDYICLFALFSASFAIKFTAPIYCGVTLLCFIAAKFIRSRNKKTLKQFALVLAAAVFGIFVMAADPYVKHMAEGKNLFYPSVGEEAFDSVDINIFQGAEGKSNAEKLFISLFSKALSGPGEEYELKVPFTVSKDEINNIAAPDVRTEGFGVFFSAILIISLALFIFALFKAKKIAAAIPAIFAFVLMALFIPGGWWARYSPYVYYIPCIMLVVFSCCDKKKIVSYACTGFLMCNCLISAFSVTKEQKKQSDIVRKELSAIASYDDRINLRINDFPSHVLWFEEYGIEYDRVYKARPDYGIFYKTTKYIFK